MTDYHLVTRDYHQLRLALLNHYEVALVDVREEAHFAEGHPLFAVNIALSKLDIEILNRIPRLTTPVTLYDNGEGLAHAAAQRLHDLGYNDVALLAGGLQGWVEAGGELFIDVNSPSKAFGKLVEHHAERTRSIIGTQSLVNSGMRNPVSALNDWLDAGRVGAGTGQSRQYDNVSNTARLHAARQARTLADKAGVKRTTLNEWHQWQRQELHTLYLFDVRAASEYEQGHLPGSRHVSGGQLVQETDHYASVRNARVVLIDDDGVRANSTGSWLAQMGWQVFVLDGLNADDFSVRGGWSPRIPALSAQQEVEPAQLAGLLEQQDIQVLDFTTSANYVNAHIPGAAWLQISALTQQGAAILPEAEEYVVTCGSSMLARYAVAQLEQLTGKPVTVLKGGNTAWKAAGLPVVHGETTLLLPRIDRYRRPYEGTDNTPETIQAYLDWEYGLVAQLDRDGTHGFNVLTA